MQDVPGWPTDNSVTVPEAAVTVAGAAREVVSVSVEASARVTDVAARTGTIEWAPGGDVHVRQDTVLSAVAPRRGDRVAIDAGYGSSLARIFTGRVDITDSSVPGGLVSEVVDDWDLLSTEVDVPSLLSRMTPYQDGDPLRQIGLTATWPTQRVLAQCGFHATPPLRTGGVLSASLNGSLWPEYGTLMASPNLPSFVTVPWGQAPRGYTATYEGGNRSMTHGPLEIGFLVAQAGTSAWSIVTVNYPGGGTGVRAYTSYNRRVLVEYAVPGTGWVRIGEIQAGQMSGAEQVMFRWGRDGAWSLRTEHGTIQSGTLTVPSALRGVPASITVDTAAGSAPIGGVNVAFAAATRPVFTRTALIDSPDGTLSASRAIVSTPAREVLRSRATAEHARMWITADGVFQWRDRRQWGVGSPVRTISDVDLLGYSTGMDYDSAYSAVTVSFIEPRIEVRSLATLLLYQGSRQVLNSGDVQREFIEVPSDEDWPWLDTSVDTLGRTGDIAGFNRGRRSWNGAVRISNDGQAEWWAYGGPGNYVSFDFEQITPRKWLHTTTVGTGLASDQTIETRSVDREKATSAVWAQWGNFNLPVIRGYARVSWLDEKRYATAVTQSLPRLEHHSAWWVQGLAVQRLADWLASEHAAPKVTITGLSIVPDARLEIGDVITLADSTYADLTARVVISKIRYQTTNGTATMLLDAEVRSVASTRKTYADVAAQAGGDTYAQFQSLIGSVTYKQHEEGA